MITESDGSALHFFLSLILILFIPIFFKNKMGGLGIAILATLALGGLKEAYDVMFNPWNMTPEALMEDTFWDLVFDCAGVFVGTIIFITGERKNRC